MTIDPIVVLIWLVIGVIAGWLSSRIVMGGGLGPIWDLIVGIVGAVIGGYALSTLGFYAGGGFVGAIVAAVIGAVVFLVIVRLCIFMLQPEKT